MGYSEPAGDFPYGTVFVRTLIIANKIDLPGAEDSFEILEELYGNDFPIISTSIRTGEGLEELKKQIFELADIIRVYTKIPGKPADKNRPFTLPKGSTLMDLAEHVHKEFVGKLRFARVWGKGKPDGLMISRDQVLEDGDVVELHV
jgi:ribosome-interacting GTPase 1